MSETTLLGLGLVLVIVLFLAILDTLRRTRSGGAAPLPPPRLLLQRIEGLELRMTAVEVTTAKTLTALERISAQLDDLVDEGKMRRIFREERDGRRRSGSVTNIGGIQPRNNAYLDSQHQEGDHERK